MTDTALREKMDERQMCEEAPGVFVITILIIRMMIFIFTMFILTIFIVTIFIVTIFIVAMFIIIYNDMTILTVIILDMKL